MAGSSLQYSAWLVHSTHQSKTVLNLQGPKRKSDLRDGLKWTIVDLWLLKHGMSEPAIAGSQHCQEGSCRPGGSLRGFKTF